MSASHINKSPLLGNKLIEWECIANEGMCSTECRIRTTFLAHCRASAKQYKTRLMVYRLPFSKNVINYNIKVISFLLCLTQRNRKDVWIRKGFAFGIVIPSIVSCYILELPVPSPLKVTFPFGVWWPGALSEACKAAQCQERVWGKRLYFTSLGQNGFFFSTGSWTPEMRLTYPD